MILPARGGTQRRRVRTLERRGLRDRGQGKGREGKGNEDGLDGRHIDTRFGGGARKEGSNGVEKAGRRAQRAERGKMDDLERTRA